MSESKEVKAAEQGPAKVCWSCKKEGVQLLRCTRCKAVYYCGVECQKKDWPSHKIGCSKAQTVTPVAKVEEPVGMDEFYKVQQIGTGNFSTIFRATSRKDGQVYAIKQAQKARLERTGKTADLFMEKHCLTKLKDCPQVIRLHRTFQDELHLFMQMEYPTGGELWQQSKHFGVKGESVFRYYVCQLFKAVRTLHDQYQIVHRDLKPENVLLTDKHEIKLIDFGTARDLSRPDVKGAGNGLKGRKPFEHYVGTPHYMAPECIHNKASQKISDVYSLSGMLYFLKVGSPPFAAGSEYLIFTKSLETQLLLPPQIFGPELSDLIHKMGQKEMGERMTLEQAMKHEYFNGVDFDNLPTFAQAEASLDPFQRKVTEICGYLGNKYSNLYKQDKEKRAKVYTEQILPYLQQSLDGAGQWKQKLTERLEVIKIQCQVLINLEDDLNLGFAEIYRRVKGMEEIKAKQIEGIGSKQLNEEEEEQGGEPEITKENEKIQEGQTKLVLSSQCESK